MIANYQCIQCHRGIKEKTWDHCHGIKKALCQKCTMKILVKWYNDMGEAINTTSAVIAASYRKPSGCKQDVRRKYKNYISVFPISRFERIFPEARMVWQRIRL